MKPLYQSQMLPASFIRYILAKMAVTDAELDQECKELEEQELTEQNDAAKSNIYSKLLAIYLLQNELVHAKFLWKRIPDSYKSVTPHLPMLWKIVQLLWSRDFTSVHLALNQEWPQDICKYMTTLKERLQDRVQNVVSKAYSNIKTEEFAKLLGMTEMQAIEVARKRDWQVDTNSGYTFPKVPEHGSQTDTVNYISCEDQLSRLTDYVSYLEN